MIRLFQKESKAMKAVFWIIIVGVCAMMVIFLVPGIFNGQMSSNSTNYATIRRGGIFGRFLPAQNEVSLADVQEVAKRITRGQQVPQMFMGYVMQEAGQSVIQRDVLQDEARHLGITASNNDVRQFLHSGEWGEVLFPDGRFIGDAQYAQLIADNFNITTEKFENEVRDQIVQDRLHDLITAGVTVSPQEVRDSYRTQATKIKFQYAVLTADALRKTINPGDAELEDFFQQNASRYRDADPETRSLQYVTVTDNNLPGGKPQVTQAEIQQYYSQNVEQYKVDAEVKVRHILISVDPNAGPAADAAAKARAEGILDQLRKDHGKNFAELAKKYSDDPGSKDQGGELGWIKHGVTVPQFDAVAFAQRPGQISGLVRTQYGYHIIQTEAVQPAHIKPLDEVKASIVDVLTKQKEGQAVQVFAQQLTGDAQKSGLAQAAAAHHLPVIRTGLIPRNANLPGMTDSSQLLTAAFDSRKGAPPETASIGDGNYAVFQITAVEPAHTPTFAEYKSHVLEDFRDQQVVSLLAKKTEELADRAQAENDLAKAAKEVGATIMTSDLVGRDQQVPDIGDLSTAAPSLFDLSVGQISSAIKTQTTGVVAKILDKQEPTPQDIASHFDATREQLLAQNRDQYFEVFASDLINRYMKAGRILVNRKLEQQMPLNGT
ncbi:MAG TPA: peptidyl-prolyl cis-trans isomerase [Acidobacteriaceae bacterium]|nr:peptidyl-prolyl cis-trans isomerase [Acidobacteriaceae bacterium]